MRFRIDITTDGIKAEDDAFGIPEPGRWRPNHKVETIYWTDPSPQLVKPDQALRNIGGSICQALATGSINLVDEMGMVHVWPMHRIHKFEITVADESLQSLLKITP